MAYATGFTLKANYELRSDQGGHGVEVVVQYELYSSNEDVTEAITEKMDELGLLSDILHERLSDRENGSMATETVRRRSPEPDPIEAVAGEGTGDEAGNDAEAGPIELSALEAAAGAATEEQVRHLREFLDEDGVSEEDYAEELKKRFKKSSLEGLTRLQASTLLFEMRRRKDFKAKAMKKK